MAKAKTTMLLFPILDSEGETVRYGLPTSTRGYVSRQGAERTLEEGEKFGKVPEMREVGTWAAQRLAAVSYKAPKAPQAPKAAKFRNEQSIAVSLLGSVKAVSALRTSGAYADWSAGQAEIVAFRASKAAPQAPQAPQAPKAAKAAKAPKMVSAAKVADATMASMQAQIDEIKANQAQMTVLLEAIAARLA